MKNKSKILPVLFGFFIMGFCDLVGVSVTYAKDYFSWSETQAGFLPSMVFIWFLLISIPISIWMDKKGRKTISLIGLLSTFIGMLLPLLTFTQTACYIAFALLGIGNTILQVSLNPLLTNVIAEGKLSSIMTAGQFIKALSSFVGPIVAGFCSVYFNNWILMFPIFAAITLISGIWLFFTPINEKDDKRLTSSFYQVISLLKNKTICLLFGGIICIVGLDVGMNVFTPKLLIENGHRRIGGIFKYDDMQGIERYKGFIQCLSDYGVKFDDDYIRWYSTKDMEEKLSKKGLLRMYRRTKDCTAMIVYNDEVANYYMDFLEERGLHVPEDVSLVSFDDAELLDANNGAQLVSAIHPKYQLGRITAKNLLRMMEDEKWQEKNYSYRFPVKIKEGNSVKKIGR